MDVDELVRAGAQLANARSVEEQALLEVHRLIRQYCAAGWSKVEVADALGVSRQTVYNVLERDI